MPKFEIAVSGILFALLSWIVFTGTAGTSSTVNADPEEVVAVVSETVEITHTSRYEESSSATISTTEPRSEKPETTTVEAAIEPTTEKVVKSEVTTSASLHTTVEATTQKPKKVQKSSGENLYGLTDAEIRDLAALVYLEAGGEPYDAKTGVATVVINRMHSSGKSLNSVINAPGQFTPASRVPSTTPSQECIDAVNDVVYNGITMPSNVLYFRANYYFDWATPYTHIGSTYFSTP